MVVHQLFDQVFSELKQQGFRLSVLAVEGSEAFPAVVDSSVSGVARVSVYKFGAECFVIKSVRCSFPKKSEWFFGEPPA